MRPAPVLPSVGDHRRVISHSRPCAVRGLREEPLSGKASFLTAVVVESDRLVEQSFARQARQSSIDAEVS